MSTTKLLEEEFWPTATVQDVEDAIASGADIHARTEEGETPLHVAARYSKTPAVVALLLDRGAYIHERNQDGSTPLHAAASNSTIPAVVETLLEHDANIHALSNDDSTPLHLAVEYNATLKVIEVLLENGADINTRNDRGQTPLSEARLRKSREVAALLEKSADSHAGNEEGA